MWFKQAQFFQLADPLSYDADALAAKLEPLAFTPCLSSLPSSHGWVCPVDDSDNGPLVHGASGYMMICLQIEEKILPSTVIRQTMQEKIKVLEADGERKIRAKEKLNLKEQITFELLPRAFSKFTRIYAYVDTKNNCMALSTTNAGKTEQFMEALRKCISNEIHSFELKKIAPIMTAWISENRNPAQFTTEKTCMLQDPQQQARVIRCQHQDLSATSIQEFIKDGFEVKKLAMAWQDRLNFILSENFSLNSIQFQEALIEQVKEINAETKQQKFDADFFIMTETFCQLLNDLLPLFIDEEAQSETQARTTSSQKMSAPLAEPA